MFGLPGTGKNARARHARHKLPFWHVISRRHRIARPFCTTLGMDSPRHLLPDVVSHQFKIHVKQHEAFLEHNRVLYGALLQTPKHAQRHRQSVRDIVQSSSGCHIRYASRHSQCWITARRAPPHRLSKETFEAKCIMQLAQPAYSFGAAYCLVHSLAF